MADVTYESLQSKIETQKSIIRQQKTAGEKGIESIRKIHPRTPPSIWFEKQKPQIKVIRGQLSELESAEKELSEHEQVIAERKAEGYKVRSTDKGIEFYKETYVPGERIQTGTRPTSVMVYWINPKTGKTGRFQGRQANMADYERQLGATGRQVTKVTTIGGGEPIYRETEGHWSTKDVILWEGSPIVKEPIKTMKEISAYSSIYERIPEGVVKKKMPTPTKFAEARGLPSDIFKEWQTETKVTTTTREMTQFEIKELLSKMTKEEKLVWYKEHAQFGIEGEEKKSWSEIQKEQPFWELTVKDGEPVIETPDTSEKLLLKWHRAKYEDVDPVTGFVGKYSAALIHGTFDPEFWIKLVRGGPEEARVVVARGERRVDPLIEEGKWGEYALSVVTSPGYTNIVLPFAAGVGLGIAFTGIGLAAKTATGTTSKILSHFARKVPYVYGGIISGMVGADIGYTAAMEKHGMVEPDTTLAKISRYGTQFGFAIAGARWATGYKPIVAYRPAGTEVLQAQKFLTTFRGKPIIPYGKPSYVARGMGGYQKVIPTSILASEAKGFRFQTLKVTKLDPDVGFATVSKYGTFGSTPTVAGRPPGLGTGLVVRPTGVLVPKVVSDILTYDIVSPIKGRIDYGLKPISKLEVKKIKTITKIDTDELLAERYDEIMQDAMKKLEVSFKLKPKKDIITKLDVINEKLGFGRITKYGVADTIATVPKAEGIELMPLRRYLDWTYKKGYLEGVYPRKLEGDYGQIIYGQKAIIEIDPKLVSRWKGRSYWETLMHETEHLHEFTGISERHLPYHLRPSEIFAYKYEKIDFPFMKKTPAWLEPTSEFQTRLREKFPEETKGALVVREKGVIVPTDLVLMKKPIQLEDIAIKKIQHDIMRGTLEAFKDRKKVGYLYYKVGDKVVQLHTIDVVKAFQHKGIGRQLTNTLREMFPEKRVVVTTFAEEAIGFYSKIGMKKTIPYPQYPEAYNFEFKPLSITKPLGRISLEPKTHAELIAERELKGLWDEKLQKQYEINLDLVAKKLGVSFKQPKPIVETLRVEEIGEGYAKVFKYGVKGITPTVVGKPPIPGPGIYTGRQPILRPISSLTIWDWLSGQPIRPVVQREPLFKILPARMKPFKYTLKDIIKEPKIELGDVITRDGQILKTVTKVETKPPVFKPKFARPEPVFDPLKTYGDYEFVRNEVIENFGRLTGMPKPRGKIQLIGFRPDVVKYFPTVIGVKDTRVKPDIDIDIKTALDRDITSMQKQFPISMVDTSFRFDVAKTYDTSQMPTQAEMQMFDYRTDVLSIDKTAIAQASAMDIDSMQRLITEQITTTKQKSVIVALPDATTYSLFGHTLGQGYHTYVKERTHFEGKKLKKGKMIRLSKRPLSRTDALSLGGMAVDNSASATFEIRPVNAMAQKPLIKLKPFESVQDKFYMKDSKYIEKPKYRIDTKGEIAGIPARAWYAEKTAKAAKKKPVSRPRARVVREPVDMFDFGMNDMLINMNKIFKGAFDGF